MDNQAILELSIKEYATQKGKTVQAVYQQMKRKENASALKGHVFTKRIGNKNVKCLDAEAIAILDKGSQATPIVIEKEDLRFELEEKKQDLDLAQKKIIFQEGQIEVLRNLLAEKEAKLLMLAEPQSQIEALKAEKAVLSADRDEKVQLLSNERKTSQTLSDELTAIKGKWWYKLFAGRKDKE